jgi:hypothetical protein
VEHDDAGGGEIDRGAACGRRNDQLAGKLAGAFDAEAGGEFAERGQGLGPEAGMGLLYIAEGDRKLAAPDRLDDAFSVGMAGFVKASNRLPG